MKTLIDDIKSDQTLLRWARWSIRYNTTREQQARDFMDKLQSNRVQLEGASLLTLQAALAAIEKHDKEN